MTKEELLSKAAKPARDAMGTRPHYRGRREVEDGGLSADYLLPTAEEREVSPREGGAAAKKAMEQGMAGLSLTEKALFSMAKEKVRPARDEVGALMGKGLVRPYGEAT